MDRRNAPPRMIGENFEYLSAMAARDLSAHHSGQLATMNCVGACRDGFPFSRADVTRGDAGEHPVLTKRRVGCGQRQPKRDATLHMPDTVANMRAILQNSMRTSLDRVRMKPKEMPDEVVTLFHRGRQRAAGMRQYPLLIFTETVKIKVHLRRRWIFHPGNR